MNTLEKSKIYLNWIREQKMWETTGMITFKQQNMKDM